MRTLNTYITEWKANTNTMHSIEKHNVNKNKYFVYLITDDKRIKIFDEDWTQFKDYKDKVYINDEHVEIDDSGFTRNTYNPGTYNVYIEDIDNVKYCSYMFYDCEDLISVPLFDTSKVKYMFKMFYGCERLVSVPLFDTSNVKNMYNMFWDCNSLSEQTKKEWSQIYDFEKDDKKK